jgi:RHS repeat-associated protein
LQENVTIQGETYPWVLTHFDSGIRKAYGRNRGGYFFLLAIFDRAGIKQELAYQDHRSCEEPLLQSVTHIPSGRKLIFSYDYDAYCLLKKVTDPDGQEYDYGYGAIQDIPFHPELQLLDITFPPAETDGSKFTRRYRLRSNFAPEFFGTNYTESVVEGEQTTVTQGGGQNVFQSTEEFDLFYDQYARFGRPSRAYKTISRPGHNTKRLILTRNVLSQADLKFKSTEQYADTDTSAYKSLDIVQVRENVNKADSTEVAIYRPKSISARCAECKEDYADYTWDPANGAPKTRTDYLGRVTEFVNDSRGLPLTETQAKGTDDERVITRMWDSRFPLKTYEEVGGVVHEWRYNTKGHLIKEITRPSNEKLVDNNCPAKSITCHQTNYVNTYDDVTKVITKTVRTGPRPENSLITEYKANGDLWKTTNALGHATEVLAWNAHGQITQQKDPNGRLTTNTYNNLRQIKSSSVAGDTTQYSYYLNGRLKTLTRPDGAIFSFTYTPAGSIKTQTQSYKASSDPTKTITDTLEYFRDSRGNILETRVNREDSSDGTDVPQQSWLDTFDLLGRHIISKDGTSTWYVKKSYNDNNLQKEQCRSTGADDICNLSDYNNLNWLWHERLASKLDSGEFGPKIPLLTLTYDTAGRVSRVIDPIGVNTVLDNNEIDRHVVENSLDFGKREADFDLAGNEAFKTDPDGYSATKYYDGLNRLYQADYSDGGQLSQQWDTPVFPPMVSGPPGNYKGRLTAISRLNAAPEGDTQVTEAYVLNPRGDVTRISQEIDGKPTLYADIDVSVGADGTGRPEKITYPGGLVVDYIYGTDDRIKSVNGIYGGTTYSLAKDITWQPLINRLRGLTFGNGYQYWRDRDKGGRLSTIRLVKPDNTNAFYATVRYDQRNRVSGYGPLTFGYDDLDHLRLQGLVDSKDKARTELDHDYNGNLTEWRKYATDNSLQAKDILAYVSQPSNRNRLQQETMTPVPGGGLDGSNTPYSYDLSGYVKSHGGFNFRYDSSRSLNLFGFNGDKTRYVYDGERRRVLKIRSSGETRYFYDRGHHLIYERMPDGNQRNYIWLGDIPLAVIDQNAAGVVTARYYIETDFANTPRFLRRATDNATVWQWPAAPYGNAKPIGPVTFNLRYPGQYYDAESGLHYNHTRYFQPRTGRYLQPDLLKLEGGPNVYTYANGNPVHYTDPTGTSSENCDCFSLLSFFNFTWSTATAMISEITKPEQSSQEQTKESPSSNQTVQNSPAGTGTSNNNKTDHAKDRQQDARDGYSHRQVGDPNRVVDEGKKLVDTETGNTVYVKGDKVVIKDPAGTLVTQFKNSRSNTLSRIESGKWEPQ